MKELWNTAQVIFAAIGGWLGYFLGGCDGLLIALVVFVAVDYVTGVMCAISDKKLSSEVGFKGICRKVLIFLLVGIANIVDVQVVGTGSVLRTAVVFFYLSNEGDYDLGNDVVAVFILHVDGSFDDCPCLHLCNFRIGNCKTASTMAHHRVELVKRADGSRELFCGNAHLLRKSRDILGICWNELM